MKILITGAAGGIGSTLCRDLNFLGHQLILVDNLRNGYLENLEQDGQIPGKFFKLDINSDEFYTLVEEESPDVVVHLAAITALPDCEVNYKECIRINVEGTAAVLGASRNSGVRKVIFASTSAVYENTKYSSEEGFSEEDQISPRLFYSLSKKMAEEICQSFSINYGMDVTILRFFNVFGPKQDIHRTSPPLINYVVREFKRGNTPILHSDGNQSRDYVFSEDVSDLIQKCIITDLEGQKIFNVSTNKTISVREIVKSIKDSIPQASSIEEEYRESHQLWDNYPSLYSGKYPLKKEIVSKETNKSSLGNNSLAKEKFNWNPRVNVLDLIKKVVQDIKI
jgi:nucleoside-diphosphate-sugar epimerase